MAGGQGGRRKPPGSKSRAKAARGGRPGNEADAERVSATARRQEAARARRRKETVRRNAALAVVTVLFIALLAVCVAGRSKDKDVQDELTSGDCRYDTRTDSGSDHAAAPPPYEVNPPSGGDHTPEAASAGVYAEGQVPPDPTIVHAMEHGFVIIWYRPGDPEITSRLEAIGEEFSDETLVVPRTSFMADTPKATRDVPVAATAWHRRLLCGSYEEDALKGFIRAYRDKGPEKGFIP